MTRTQNWHIVVASFNIYEYISILLLLLRLIRYLVSFSAILFTKTKMLDNKAINLYELGRNFTLPCCNWRFRTRDDFGMTVLFNGKDFAVIPSYSSFSFGSRAPLAGRWRKWATHFVAIRNISFPIKKRVFKKLHRVLTLMYIKIDY
jgi:hypothetical protein